MKISKICKKCNIEKDISYYYKVIRKNNYIEYSSKCKECKKEERKQNNKIKSNYDNCYYQNNKNKILNRVNEYRNKNKDMILIRKKKYYQLNKVKLRIKQNAKYSTNLIFRFKKLESEKLRYLLNKEFIIKRNKKWRQNNKYKINAKLSFRRKNNIYVKLHHLISTSIRYYLFRNNISKNKKSILKYMPYSINELKQYIESLFEPWMSWNNHGLYIASKWDDNDSSTWTWQIDHIIPQSDLSYTSMNSDNFKKCWALNNLRPLSAKQNILDGASRKRHAK